MKKLNALTWFFALCICLPLQGQNKTLAKANKFYKAQDYHAAIPLFEEGLLEDNNLVAKTKLANAYKNINQLDKAEKLYATIVYDDKVKVGTFKSYGETLMGNGKYAAAKFWFEEYLKEKPGDASVVQNLASCNKVYNIKPLFYDVVIESFPFNSKFDDNGAVMLGDKIVFSSDRPSGLKLLKQKISDDGREFINIYESTKSGAEWTTPSNFENKFNLLNKNVGPVTFNEKGDYAIFSRNSDVANKSDEYSMQLYAAEFDGKKWKDITPLNFCKPGNNYMHPALSPDGTMLFFATDKAGGEGKTDLYVSYKKSAAWSLPENLGTEINTSESEGFPFVSSDGKLYFCSKGRIGFGGFDIYAAERNETTGTWHTPVNLGFPMNSSADDVSFFINKEQNAGLVASSRNNQGDDIFTFYIQEEVEKEEAVAFVPKPKEKAMDVAKIEEEIKAIGTSTVEEELQPVEDQIVLETVVEPSAPQVVEVSKKIEPTVEKVKPIKEKKKRVANVINKKSDEAVVVEMKSDTTRLDDSQIDPINNSTTVVTNEAVLTSAKSNPVDLVEVSTSGAMGNVNADIEEAIKEEIEEPIVQKVIEVEEPQIQVEEKIKEEVIAVDEVKVEEIDSNTISTEVKEMKTVEEEVIAEVPTPTPTPTPKVKKKKKKTKKAIRGKKVEVEKEEVVAELTDRGAEEKMKVEKLDLPTIDEKVAAPTKEIFKAGTPLAIADLSRDLKSGNTDKKYSLADLKYSFNATEITTDLGAALDALVPLLNANPAVKLQFVGHTGSIGSDQKNQRLSVARAAAAVDYLIGQGVGPDRVSFDGKGETELLNGCTDGILCGKAQHQENERIEIKVLQ